MSAMKRLPSGGTRAEMRAGKWKRQSFMRELLKGRGRATWETVFKALESRSKQPDGFRMVSERQAHYDMGELLALGIIRFDDEKKEYIWPEVIDADLRAFNSEKEYNLAIKHTKSIVLTGEELQGIDQNGIRSMLIHRLASSPGLDGRGTETLAERSAWAFAHLIQHLRSGYRSEFWEYLEEYSRKQTEYGFPSQIPSQSGLSLHPDLLRIEELETARVKLVEREEGVVKSYRWREQPRDFPYFLKFTRGVTTDGGIIQLAREKSGNSAEFQASLAEYRKALENFEEEVKRKKETLSQEFEELFRRIDAVPKSDVERARDLFNMLDGALDRIAHEAEQGIPLKGLCDSCPKSKVAIRGRKPKAH
jgi:hypothetical protein